MSNDNQYVFEVARDLISMLLELPDGEKLEATIKRHGDLYDWDTNRGWCYSYSEIANVLKHAWKDAHERLKDGRPMKPSTIEEYKIQIERLTRELDNAMEAARSLWRGYFFCEPEDYQRIVAKWSWLQDGK